MHEKPALLTTSESLALDVLRVSAAAMVAMGHLTQPYFSTGWRDLTFLARGAVAIFFILSGFVIRYVTTRKHVTPADYALDRASRIYSVALPALLVTLIADSISRHANPGFYAQWAYAYDHPLRGILENLLFTAQLWTHITVPLSNSPFWSLNYEVCYYVLYAFAFYLAGWKRWVFLAVTLLAVGPPVLVLAPLWLAGCFAHDLYRQWNASGTTARYLDRIIAGCLLMLAGLFAARRFFPGLLEKVRAIPVPHYHFSARIKPAECAAGLFGMLLFFRLLTILRRIEIAPDCRAAKTIRFISEGTFPLYLLHFPLLVLIAACIPYNHASGFQKILILLTICTVGVLAGEPCNRLKTKLRSIWRSQSASKVPNIGRPAWPVAPPSLSK